MIVRRTIAAALLLICAATFAAARRRDPLTDAEVDQLREAAQTPEQRIHLRETAIEPDKRLKLMVEFTKARMLAIDQLRSDPKMAKERGRRIHDLLEDLSTLLNEIGDNIDHYAGWDMRKPLKEVIEMDAEFQVKLRSIKEATDAATQAEMADYKFSMEDAIDAVNADAESSRQAL